MKFSADSADLKRAIRAACEVIPSRAPTPELTCVYLNASEGQLLVSGRNESVFVELTCPCSPVKDGEALVPAKTLLDYVSLAEGEVILSLDSKNALTILSGSHKSTIVCLDASHYQPAQFTGKPAFSLPGNALSLGLSRVAFSAAVELARPAMVGVRVILLPDGSLRFGAIDNVRVAICHTADCDVADGAPADLSVTVPAAILRLVQTLFGGMESVLFSFEPGRGMFSCEECRLVFAAPAGAFPSAALDRMMGLSYPIRVTASAKAMADAASLASVAAESSPAGSRFLVRLETDAASHELRFSAGNEMTAASTSVPTDHDGGDITIGFSVRLLRDAIAACAKEADDLEISFTSSSGPARIAPVSDSSTLTTFVMPVRMA